MGDPVETLFVKPAAGALVRDPSTMLPLPPEGAEVPRTAYYLRRLAAGDLIQAAPPANAVRAKKEA